MPLSVRLSATFVYSICWNVSSIWFHRLVAHAILVLPHRMLWQHSDADSPNGGVECRGETKIAIFNHSHRVLSAVRTPSVIHTVALVSGGVVCCSQKTDDELFMTLRRSQQNNLIILSGKSEAAVTNNRRLRSRYYSLRCWSYSDNIQPCEKRRFSFCQIWHNFLDFF